MSKPKPANPAFPISDTDLANAIAQIGSEVDHQPGVSWEAHLFGAIAGAVATFLVRTHVHAPRLGGVDLD